MGWKTRVTVLDGEIDLDLEKGHTEEDVGSARRPGIAKEVGKEIVIGTETVIVIGIMLTVTEKGNEIEIDLEVEEIENVNENIETEKLMTREYSKISKKLLINGTQ